MMNSKNLVQVIFKELEANTFNLENYEEELKQKGIPEKYFFQIDKYPQLGIRITKEDIEELKKSNILDENGIINLDNIELNPLIKLLYAMAWKQGDLPKFSSIISGILDIDRTKTTGKVFNQFGKHLNNPNEEPIIDQHVLRAYLTYVVKFKNDQRVISPQQLVNYDSNKIKPSHIEEYKIWLNNYFGKDINNREQLIYYIDKTLYALGKYLKDYPVQP